MRLRTVLAALGYIALGAILLAAIAPWINPCVGPLRFVHCIDLESLRTSQLVSPWLGCAMGICDFFPSALERTIRLGVVLVVASCTGVLCARLMPKLRFLRGGAAAVVTVASAAVLTIKLYAGPAA